MLLKGRNPFLFRGPIPTFAQKLGIPVFYDVAIPSYSEVLFLQGVVLLDPIVPFRSQSLLIQRSYSYFIGLLMKRNLKKSRNPFLFRGPIPTDYTDEEKKKREEGRNPFLFRGPIPTTRQLRKWTSSESVAIHSYSEVLFLHLGGFKMKKQN